MILQSYVNNERQEWGDKKIIFADLDGTLIETLTNETFPRGVWDMKIRFDVLLSMVKMFPNVEHIYIVTNQGGIESGYVDRKAFDYKINYVKYSIEEFLKGVKVDFAICESNDKGNRYRKPNNGMFKRFSYKVFGAGYRLSNMVMIGDASGLEGQFSDSDLKFAENSNIDYIDVDELLKQRK